MRRKMMVCGILWLTSVFSPGVLANPRVEAAKLRVVNVAFAKFPPWNYGGENSAAKGILPDFYSEIFAGLPIQLNVEVLPIARLHNSIALGKLDIFFTADNGQEYQCCTRVEGVHVVVKSVVVGRSDASPWPPEGIPNAEICRVRFSTHKLPNVQLFETSSLQNCARMVSKRHASWFIGESTSVAVVIKGLTPKEREDLGPPTQVSSRRIQMFINRKLAESPEGRALMKKAAATPLGPIVEKYAK